MLRIGIGMYVLSPPWTPSQLFSAGQQGAWYDPSDLTTVFQDAAGTTPAAVGDPVGLLLDKSGNGNHASQSTAAARPVLRQTAGGLYYLEFDGVDDRLTGDVGAVDSNPIQMLLSGSTLSAALNAGFLCLNPSSTTSGAQRAVGIGSADELKVDTRGHAALVMADMSVASVFEGRFSDPQSDKVEAAVNGGAFTVKTEAVDVKNTDGALHIGSGLTGIYIQADIYGTVIIDRHLSDAERSHTVQYLGDKAGVTL